MSAYEKFKGQVLRNYGLCSSHYLSTEALSWDAMLNIIKVEFKLISDADAYLFFEKGMRSGVYYISKRHNKTNKKYLKSCNPKQESKHIIYLDTNNMYGYGMSNFFSNKWI